MTATAATNAAWAPIGNTGLPPGVERGLVASATAGRGQFLTVSPSTGYASLNDGTVPLQIAMGVSYPAILTGSSTVAGSAHVDAWQGWGGGLIASTIANDSFTDADFGIPFWIKDENTPGKLSNYSGSNRSIGGLVFGLGSDGNPVLWSGPVAALLARAVMIAQSFPLAQFQIADAAASTAIAERAIPRTKIHGVVTSVEFTGAAIAADNSDYDTITFAKRGLSDAYATATTIATYDTRAANQGAVTAFTPAAFALSAVAGALNLLETDIVTITTVKGGAGKVLTGAFFVNGKAI